MGGIKGDYTGFTYNGIHSADLGLTRVSTSNRYEDTILPTSTSKTIQAPGGDETYFFNQNYTQKPFKFDVAYDNMTPEQKRQLTALLGDKKPHSLILDEDPYKVYYAVVSSAPSLKFVAFDGEEDTLVYKGEGTIQMIAYYPFARSRYKFLNEYTNQSVPSWNNDLQMLVFNNNLDEWAAASRMRSEKLDLDTYTHTAGAASGYFNIYNAGDLPADYVLKFTMSETHDVEIALLNPENQEIATYTLNGITDSIIIDSKLGLVYDTDGKVQCDKLEGVIFKIPTMNYSDTYKIRLLVKSAEDESIEDEPFTNATLNYNYLYY